MSTTSSCRREEVAICQPDKTVPLSAEALEKQTMSEKQFMWDHSLYSAISSWLFAIAGATNIGVLGVLSSKILTAAEQGRPLFKSADPSIIPVMGNKKFNNIALGMTAFGGVCMAVSNWLESKKVVTEWQLGAGKLQRKAAIADEKAQAAQDSTDTAAPPHKNWVASVTPNAEHCGERCRS